MLSITQRFAHFAANLTYEEIPKEIREKIKVCILHGISIGLAGYKLEPAVTAREIAFLEHSGEHGATVFGTDHRTNVSDAAFAGSVMFHCRIQEDTHGTTHIGTVSTPLAIALAEAYGCSGKELLTAVAAAYEIAAAAGKDCTEDSTARGFRATPIYGIFGATAAAAVLMKLTEEEMTNAFGLAAAFAFGSLGNVATTEWRYEVGVVPRSAWTAVMLAQKGATANPYALEHEKGFYHLFVKDLEDFSGIGKDLGRVWELREVALKLYPVCAFNQSHVINVLALLKEQKIDISRISSVHIEASRYEASYPGAVYRGPFDNHGQSGVSAPFSVAASLAAGKCTYQIMTEYQEPKILELIEKTTTEGSEEIPFLGSRITLEMEDKMRISREFFPKPYYYSPDYQTEAENVRRMKEEIPLTGSAIEKLISLVENLEASKDMDELLRTVKVENTKQGERG